MSGYPFFFGHMLSFLVYMVVFIVANSSTKIYVVNNFIKVSYIVKFFNLPIVLKIKLRTRGYSAI